MKGRGGENLVSVITGFTAYDRKQKPNFDTTLPVPRLLRPSVPNLLSVLRECVDRHVPLSVVSVLQENAN